MSIFIVQGGLLSETKPVQLRKKTLIPSLGGYIFECVIYLSVFAITSEVMTISFWKFSYGLDPEVLNLLVVCKYLMISTKRIFSE